MTTSNQNESLSKECVIFTKYMVKQTPNEYVLKKYLEAVRIKILTTTEMTRFERFLNKILLTLPLSLKVIDIYCNLFFSKSIIRRKMIVLLSILESSSPFHHFIDTPSLKSRISFFYQFVKFGVLFALNGFIAALVLFPIHMGFVLAGDNR